MTTDRSSTTPRRGVTVRRSTVLLAAGVVLTVVLVGWGVDRLIRIGAQSVVARAVQKQTGVTQRPKVEIDAGVFVWQAIRGRYDRISIDVQDIETDNLRIADVQAVARGVHLSFHDVLVRDFQQVVIERTDETAYLRYADINNYLKAIGRRVTLAPGKRPGEVKVTGTVTVLGRNISASADAKASAGPGRLDIVPTSIDSGLSGLDSASRAVLGQALTVRVPLTALPFGQKLTGIDVGKANIVVHAAGTGVVFSG